MLLVANTNGFKKSLEKRLKPWHMGTLVRVLCKGIQRKQYNGV